MFTVHGRGVFTQDTSGYFSNSKVCILQKWDRENVFTIKRCSLIRGVHYERFHCTCIIRTMIVYMFFCYSNFYVRKIMLYYY